MNMELGTAAKLLRLDNVTFSFFVGGNEFSCTNIQKVGPEWRAYGIDAHGEECVFWLSAQTELFVPLAQFEL